MFSKRNLNLCVTLSYLFHLFPLNRGHRDNTNISFSPTSLLFRPFFNHQQFPKFWLSPGQHTWKLLCMHVQIRNVHNALRRLKYVFMSNLNLTYRVFFIQAPSSVFHLHVWKFVVWLFHVSFIQATLWTGDIGNTPSAIFLWIFVAILLCCRSFVNCCMFIFVIAFHLCLCSRVRAIMFSYCVAWCYLLDLS